MNRTDYDTGMNRLRIVGLIGAVLLLAGGVIYLIIGARTPGLVLTGTAVLMAVLIVLMPLRFNVGTEPEAESDDINHLPLDRRKELIRGTSMHLRDMKYRYSVRHDQGTRPCFNREINGILLGFVPVILLDTTNDRQGYGYIAFPYDGTRWRGPGLPCGGSPEQAMEHAARCVEPAGGQEEVHPDDQ